MKTLIKLFWYCVPRKALMTEYKDLSVLALVSECTKDKADARRLLSRYIMPEMERRGIRV